jgi:hypothetical protein
LVHKINEEKIIYGKILKLSWLIPLLLQLIANCVCTAITNKKKKKENNSEIEIHGEKPLTNLKTYYSQPGHQYPQVMPDALDTSTERN